VLTRVAFGKRKDRHENRFIDDAFLQQYGDTEAEISKECLFIDPKSLDSYALGVVIFEYVASVVEGVPVIRPGAGDGGGGVGMAGPELDEFWLLPPAKRQRLATRKYDGASSVRSNRLGLGWVSCSTWHQIVQSLCAVQVLSLYRSLTSRQTRLFFLPLALLPPLPPSCSSPSPSPSLLLVRPLPLARIHSVWVSE
jgi:hypothetical protein